MECETGKIYKLVSKFTDVIYVGSSIETLTNRLYNHKHITTCSSRELFKLGKVDIVLLEQYPCESELDLRIREQFYMDKFREEGYTLVNNRRAYTSPEQLKEHYKEYREQNKDKIKEHHKKYRENNKDKIKEHYKEYREQNKNKINEKFTCECGGRYTNSNKSRHIQTKKHISYL